MADTVEKTLDLKSKLRQKSVVAKVREIDWRGEGSDAPLVVEFDPTTACNLACPDCISRDLLNQGYFTRKRIRKLVVEMVEAGVKAVVLIGGGEPLAHPETGWVIEYLATNGVQVGITTNGILMDRYMDVIAEHASWVRVSMDAGSPDIYNRIRPSVSGRSEFQNAVNNMRELAARKQGKLGYSFMIYSENKFDQKVNAKEAPYQVSFSVEARDSGEFSNVGDIYLAAELAKDIGCDYFEIKPMYDISHYAIIQEHELMVQAKELIARTLDLNGDGFKVLQATKLHHILNGEDNIEEKHYKRCAVAQLRTLVTPSGSYVCPYFRGSKKKQIGDVMKQSFLEMWHGEQRAKVIANLDPSRDCKMHCIRHDSNLLIESMVEDGVDDNQVLDDFDMFI